MDDQISDNVNFVALLEKIAEVTTALELTRKFQAELRDSSGHSTAFIEDMVQELETRLTALTAIRVSQYGDDVRS